MECPHPHPLPGGEGDGAVRRVRTGVDLHAGRPPRRPARLRGSRNRQRREVLDAAGGTWRRAIDGLATFARVWSLRPSALFGGCARIRAVPSATRTGRDDPHPALLQREREEDAALACGWASCTAKTSAPRESPPRSRAPRSAPSAPTGRRSAWPRPGPSGGGRPALVRPSA